MVREMRRPAEDSALREMRLEGLEGVLEHTRNAILRARDEGDLDRVRLYAKQMDRAAAEMLARQLERREIDRHFESMNTPHPHWMLRARIAHERLNSEAEEPEGEDAE